MLYTVRLLSRSFGPTGILIVTAGLCTFIAHLLFDRVPDAKIIMALMIVALATMITAAVGEIINVSSRWGSTSNNKNDTGRISLSPQPFLARMLEVKQHHQEPHRMVYSPTSLSVDIVKQQGFGTERISLFRSLCDSFTWVLEYKFQAFLRVLQVDWKIGQYGRQHSLAGAYQCVMNSSLACFLDDNTGNVVLFDTLLYSGTTASKLYRKITLVLDHESRTCSSVSLQEDGKENEPAIVTDADEIGSVILMAIGLKTHVNVHYHANGVSELASFWPVANTSNKLTQAMNRAAVFVAPTFMSNYIYTVDHNADVLGSNILVEGLPSHRHLHRWAATTSTYMILAKARPLLHKALSTVMNDTITIKEQHLFAETILAATILHAADHYYADKFLGYKSHSHFLQVDMTLLRTALLPPNHYRTGRFLCREYPDDAICQALYQAAHEVDPEFADTALFVGIAN